MDWKTDKLKPTQPFFVLNSENFRQEVYLKQGISHFYSFDVIGETDFVAVPDGCIDIVFEYDDGDITGYATGTVLKHKNKVFSPGRNGKKEIFGVRFMPGFRPAGLKVKLKDLIDHRIELSDTAFGDSMTAGNGTTIAYHMYLAEKTGWTCLNWGVGGSGWAFNMTASTTVGKGVEGLAPSGVTPDYNTDYNTLDGDWTGALPCAIIRSDGTVLAVGIV